ncbi:MAG: PAS domain S-box protein [Magnetococcales bacterium]|nr:PAS domain S-box protein [Magnetococcales bacterium]
MEPSFSLRKKIITVGITILLLGFGALIFVSTDSLLKSARKHSQTNLEHIAFEKAEVIKREINSILLTGRFLARSLEHIQQNSATNPRKTAAYFLQNLVKSNPFIGMAAAWEPNAFDGDDDGHIGKPFGSPKGRMAIYYYRTKNGIQELLLDMRPVDDGGIQFGWYDIPVQENRDYLMPPYLNPVEGAEVWMTTAAIPIRNKSGQAIGSATVDLPLEYIQSLVSNIKVFTNGYASLVSQDGNWLAHPDSTLWGKPVQNTFLKKALFATTSKKVFHGVMDDGKITNLLVSIPLSFGTSDIWTLIILAPMDEVNYEAIQLRNKLLQIAAIIIILATIIYWVFAQTTTRPLQELIYNLRHGDDESTTDYNSSIKRADEIGILARTLYDYKEKQRLAEEALVLSEEHFRMLVETTSDWIWEIDTKANFKYVSPGVIDVLGYDPKELIGKKSGFDLMPHDDANKAREEYGLLLSKAQPFDAMININVHKDGHKVFMESSGRPFFDNSGNLLGYRGVDRDITERLRAEKELQKSNLFMEQLFNITHFSIAFLDPAFNFIRVNQSYADSCGYQPDYFPGKNHFVMYPNSENEAIFRQVVETGEPFTILAKPFEFPDHPEWGISYWDWTLTPIKNSANEVEWLIFALVNVTKTKQNEFGLIEAKEEAEKANLAKSEFLAVMSHEIRTPLNAILGMSEVAIEFNQDPDMSRFLKVIERSGKNLMTLIEDILDLSQIESGRLSLEHKPIDIKELTQEALDIHSINAKNKWLDLTCQIHPDTPDKFINDQKRLRQVLLNLIGNAVKFTDQGAVELRVSCPSKQTMQFSVVDSGIGISEEKQKLIFKPFSQADSSNTRQYGGVGLGLTICKRLVDAMDGKIWVESELGKGSTFHFSVPLTSKDHGTKQSGTADNDKEESMQEAGNGATILLAEDKMDNSIVIEAFMSNSSHNLDIVENGDLAVKRIKSGKKYDLVLMDIQMPVMDGLEATRQIRVWESQNGCASTPILALTAHAMRGDEEKSLAAGCDAHITKPINKTKLLEFIDRFTR